ncbi:hypothetical protein SJI45_18985 [Streptomyces sp. S399]|uniref:hypothetical protein n=1 Tax=Streptomyces sp. S399 TaxID=3096009 RepID=UPI002A7F59C6|nr:hypothetical protein [Streptomyces sp. S399]WPR52822.1 hypothetical protein SJI45_18985 [Streptomyces sp. S399]
MSTTYTIGQRVRTAIDLAPGWEGAWGAPAGTLGTVTGLPVGQGCGYGVVLDGDPDRLPVALDPHEFTGA